MPLSSLFFQEAHQYPPPPGMHQPAFWAVIGAAIITSSLPGKASASTASGDASTVFWAAAGAAIFSHIFTAGASQYPAPPGMLYLPLGWQWVPLSSHQLSIGGAPATVTRDPVSTFWVATSHLHELSQGVPQRPLLMGTAHPPSGRWQVQHLLKGTVA
jgi:hypothetical protein